MSDPVYWAHFHSYQGDDKTRKFVLGDLFLALLSAKQFCHGVSIFFLKSLTCPSLRIVMSACSPFTLFTMHTKAALFSALVLLFSVATSEEACSGVGKCHDGVSFIL